MSITLLCPNGHKLVCPESQAGKRGKCPQCGAIFRVPELKPAAAPGEGSGVKLGSGPNLGGAAPVPIMTGPGSGELPAAEEEAPAEEQPQEETPSNPIRACGDDEPLGEGEIAFLCPNGHHLAGDSSLGGLRGECPECGTKFLVPTLEELAEAEKPQVFNPLNFDPASLTPAATPFGPAPDVKSQMPAFFERLWEYKGQNRLIEIYLQGGSILVPHGYAAKLSRQAEGVFLIKEEDGSFAIAVVAWKEVSQVLVRGLPEAPPEIFDVPEIKAE